MKRTIFIILICLFTLAAALADQADVMSVQVREGALRQAPTFLGKIIAKLAYGRRVNIIEEKSGWVRIATVEPEPELAGWMHTSALTTKKIELKAGDKDVETGASGDELALAGKGFDEATEKEYRKKNPDVDFTWVDKMESFTVSQNQIQDFITEGDLQNGTDEL